MISRQLWGIISLLGRVGGGSLLLGSGASNTATLWPIIAQNPPALQGSRAGFFMPTARQKNHAENEQFVPSVIFYCWTSGQLAAPLRRGSCRGELQPRTIPEAWRLALPPTWGQAPSPPESPDSEPTAPFPARGFSSGGAPYIPGRPPFERYRSAPACGSRTRPSAYPNPDG